MKVVATLVQESKPVMLWRITQAGDGFSYAVEKARTVPGARFRRAEKAWAAPATIDACHVLRQAFPETLEILPPLARWYKDNVEGTKAQEKLSAKKKTSSKLKNLKKSAPKLHKTLRDDQRVGVKWIADGYRGSGLVADKPGLGKTLEVIGGVLEADLKGNILVICPKISVRNVWQKELNHWTNETVYAARGTRAKREATLREFLEDSSERKWLVCVAEMLRVERRKPSDDEPKSYKHKRNRIEGFLYEELFSESWDAIIVDESQKLLGSLTVAKANLAGEGLQKLPATASTRRIAMSGTPFGKGGRVQGMFGTLHWLWPDEYTSFWRWAERHFIIEEEFIGKGKTAKRVGGLRDGMGGEAFLKSLGPRILRRTKEEVLPNLPPKQYVDVMCEMGSAQMKQYKQLGDDAEVVLPNGTVMMANGALAEITRARQIANGVVTSRPDGQITFTGESCKVDALIEKLDARGILDDAGDTKVVVATKFNEFLTEAIIPALESNKVKYHVMTGKSSESQRDKAMDDFQADGGARVFLMNSAAGGVSINLDAADELHEMDELDNPEDNEQLEDRIHRASRNHQVTIFKYVTEGTYDENISESVEGKRVQQFDVLDGRRGLEYARQAIKYRKGE